MGIIGRPRNMDNNYEILVAEHFMVLIKSMIIGGFENRIDIFNVAEEKIDFNDMLYLTKFLVVICSEH